MRSAQLLRSVLLITFCGWIAAAAGVAQTVVPNANGGNSSFGNTGAAQTPNPATRTSAGDTPLAAVPEGFSTLRISAGTLLRVAVYNEPELAAEVRVDDKGDVHLPLIGAVAVGGKTIFAAETAIQNKYRLSEILKDPQVTLNVMQYAGSSVTVLGEVQSPGRFQMLAPRDLLDVLGMAGGETVLAGDTIRVESPDGKVQTYHYTRGDSDDQLRAVKVLPDETVRVPRAGVVYVLGAVYRPGGYVMQEDGKLNVVEAVSLAQGTLMQARIGDMRVIRRQPDGSLMDIPVHYNQVMRGKADPIELEPQDIVYVPVSKLKSVFTAGSSIVGETGAATIYAAK